VARGEDDPAGFGGDAVGLRGRELAGRLDAKVEGQLGDIRAKLGEAAAQLAPGEAALESRLSSQFDAGGQRCGCGSQEFTPFHPDVP
jgi:hypothetical protein